METGRHLEGNLGAPSEMDTTSKNSQRRMGGICEQHKATSSERQAENTMEKENSPKVGWSTGGAL